jgi:hypothetical protein
MKSLGSFLLAGVVLATLTLAVAAQSSPDASFRVAAAGSCQGWFGTCVSRCTTLKNLNCDRAFCSNKLGTCRQTGCWTEGAAYGNAVHCGLKK